MNVLDRTELVRAEGVLNVPCDGFECTKQAVQRIHVVGMPCFPHAACVHHYARLMKTLRDMRDVIDMQLLCETHGVVHNFHRLPNYWTVPIS